LREDQHSIEQIKLYLKKTLFQAKFKMFPAKSNVQISVASPDTKRSR